MLLKVTRKTPCSAISGKNSPKRQFFWHLEHRNLPPPKNRFPAGFWPPNPSADHSFGECALPDTTMCCSPTLELVGDPGGWVTASGTGSRTSRAHCASFVHKSSCLQVTPRESNLPKSNTFYHDENHESRRPTLAGKLCRTGRFLLPASPLGSRAFPFIWTLPPHVKQDTYPPPLPPCPPPPRSSPPWGAVLHPPYQPACPHGPVSYPCTAWGGVFSHPFVGVLALAPPPT